MWARRAYAPMFIHRPELANYKRAIEAALPDYVVAFDDLCRCDSAVPWHCDYDSLGPFDVSFASILEVTSSPCTRICKIVVAPSSGPLLAADGGSAYAVNTLTSSFGGLAALTARLPSRLARRHILAPRPRPLLQQHGDACRHAGRGACLLVRSADRRDVVMRRELVEAASSGTLGTRRLKEFADCSPSSRAPPWCTRATSRGTRLAPVRLRVHEHRTAQEAINHHRKLKKLYGSCGGSAMRCGWILLGDLKGWTHVRFMLCVFSALRPAIPRPNLKIA